MADSIPVFTSQHDYEFEEEEPDHNLFIGEVESICNHLRNGSLVHEVFDKNEFSTQPITRTVVLKHADDSTSQWVLAKSQPGPIQSYHDSNEENSTRSNLLTDDSQVVFIKETFETMEDDNESRSLDIVIFYINLRTKTWVECSRSITLTENFATHTFVLNSSQLLIYAKRPVSILAFDFHGDITSADDVTVFQWQGDLNATRILSCLNFVMVFSAQNEFLCLTFQKTGIIESKIKKPNSAVKEEYDELVQIINVNGKVVLIAQKDSAVLFLTIKNNSFIVARKVELKTIDHFQSHYPLVIKSMFCWKRSRLFIPVACMKKTFPQDDQVQSEGMSIVEIDMNTFQVSSISQIQSKVDIYQEIIHLAVLQRDRIYLRKERKYFNGKKARVISGHLVKLLPQTLREASIRAIINNEKPLFYKGITNNVHLRRQILESYDF